MISINRYTTSTATPKPYRYTFVAPLIFIFGLVGNTLTLLILDGKRTTTNAFLLSIAVADLSLILLLLPPIWINTVFKWHIMTQSPLSCRLLKILMYSSGDVGVWLLTIFSIDRAIAIYSPLTRRNLLSSYRKVYLLAAVTMVVLFCKNLHIFWTTGNIIKGGDSSYCGPMQRYHFFENKVRPYIMLVIVVLVPFLLMLVSNVIIVMVLKRRDIKHYQHSSKKNNQFRQTIITCLIVSFAFFILMIPGFILAAIRPQWSQTKSYIHYGETAEALNVLLAGTNHSINFYLYCLSGKAFRRDLFNMLSRITNRSDTKSTEVRQFSNLSKDNPAIKIISNLKMNTDTIAPGQNLTFNSKFNEHSDYIRNKQYVLKEGELTKF